MGGGGLTNSCKHLAMVMTQKIRYVLNILTAPCENLFLPLQSGVTLEEEAFADAANAAWAAACMQLLQSAGLAAARRVQIRSSPMGPMGPMGPMDKEARGNPGAQKDAMGFVSVSRATCHLVRGEFLLVTR